MSPMCAFVFVSVRVFYVFLRVCRCLHVCGPCSPMSTRTFACICVSPSVSVCMLVCVCSMSHIRDVSERHSQSY